MSRIAMTIGAALTFTTMTFAAAEATPHSYPLICVGGGAMQAKILSNATIQLKFGGGQEAGSPQPGQCTWMDRGFRPGEPTVMLLRRDREGMDYILNGMLGNGRFIVHVYNNNAGAMMVTQVRP